MREVIERRVQGYSHILQDKECQDFCVSEKLPDGTVIMAVADGHGSNSCPYSADGSRLAGTVFRQSLTRLYYKYEDSGRLMSVLNRDGSTVLSKELLREWQLAVLEEHRQSGREFPLKSAEEGSPVMDEPAVYKMYGTTLLGLLVTSEFVFALQIGDGDIAYVDEHGFSSVVESDKLLGVETHSMSSPDAWKKAISVVHLLREDRSLPAAFILTTDGFANSFPDDRAYERSCEEYVQTLNTYGPRVLEKYLPEWLSETSRGGCGDDITMAICYDYPDDFVFQQEPEEEAGPQPDVPDAVETDPQTEAPVEEVGSQQDVPESEETEPQQDTTEAEEAEPQSDVSEAQVAEPQREAFGDEEAGTGPELPKEGASGENESPAYWISL